MLRSIAVAGLSLVAMSAQAALVVRDLHASGDGLVTLDTASGLEWLDASVTNGMTLQQFLDGQGGLKAAGFLTGSPVQFQTLLGHAGADSIISGFSSTSFTTGNYQAWDLLQTLGVVGLSSCGSTSPGPLADAVELGNDTRNVYKCQLQGSTSAAISYLTALSAHKEWAAPVLVRNTVVPIAPAVWLFGSALGLMVGVRRKQVP